MNSLKRILGTVFIILGYHVAEYIIDVLAIPKFSTGKGEDLIPAIIYVFLVPIISLSLIIFGMYAIQGEYADKQPHHK